MLIAFIVEGNLTNSYKLSYHFLVYYYKFRKTDGHGWSKLAERLVGKRLIKEAFSRWSFGSSRAYLLWLEEEVDKCIGEDYTMYTNYFQSCKFTVTCDPYKEKNKGLNICPWSEKGVDQVK